LNGFIQVHLTSPNGKTLGYISNFLLLQTVLWCKTLHTSPFTTGCRPCKNHRVKAHVSLDL
jgi:hypothetical protein